MSFKINSKIIFNFLVALFIIGAGFLLLPNFAQAAVTYDVGTKRITVTGYTESVPCNFTDLWNADKAGTLELWSGTPAIDITLTNQIQASDAIALEIDFILSGSDAGVGDTIVITGIDKDDNAQSETLTTEADGTFTTTKWYKTITDVDCIGFSSGTLTIRQNQWGVIFMQGANTFRIECFMYIGDDTTPSYFADTKKNIIIDSTKFVTASGQTIFKLSRNSYTQFGEVISEGLKTTRYGCHFYLENADEFYYGLFAGYGQLRCYTSTFTSKYRKDILISLRVTSGDEISNRFWNCYFSNGVSFSATEETDIYNLSLSYTTSLIRRPVESTTIEKISGKSISYGVWFQSSAGVVKDVWGRNCGYAFRMEGLNENCGDCYIIDGDFDSWAGQWRTTHADRRMYRQHSLNLQVIDKDNNPIKNAIVTLKDKDGGLIINTEKIFYESDLEESESFETGFGNWLSSGELGWTRHSGGTPSGNTGPSSAYDGDYYIYTEASYSGVGYPDKTSILTYNGSLPAVGGIKFRYNKYGIDCGELSVDAYYSGAWHQIWMTPAGNEGDEWKEVKLDFPAGTTNVRINSITGDYAYGDTALDLIKIYNNVMQEQYYFETGENGAIPEQVISYGYYNQAGGDIINSYSPHTLTISHQDYPTKEFKFTMDKKQNLIIALKDRPMSVGSIKVWGTEYADNEAGTIYAQITYGDGSPCDTVASNDITATVYKSDGTVIINEAQMSYIANSNGIYKYDFTGGTFTDEGVYIIDVTASSINPNITAYNSNEIHISKSANLISQNLDRKISEVASSTAQAVWSYTGSALDATGNAINNVWSFAIRKLTSRQIANEANEHIAQEENVASNVWNTATSTITTSGSIGKHLVDNIDDKISNIASNVWGYTGDITSTLIQNLGDVVWNSYSGVRKLTSRQIGNGTVYIPGVTESGTITQVANEDDQETVKYDIDLVRKATFDFAGIVDSGTTLTLIDSELTHPDDHWNNYELWMMSGNNIGLKVTICDFDKASHTITICGDALSQSIATDDQYVISHERKLVHAIWNWSDRQLTEVGNIASAVWGWTGSPRQLTSQWTDEVAPVDLAQTVDVSSLATSAELASAKTDIITEIDANETLINNLNNITAADVWSHADRSIDDPDAIWEYALDQIGDTGSIGLLLKNNIDASVSSRASHTAADVWLESTRTLTDYATSTIALAIWNNAQRTLTNYGNNITAADVWNVLSATLDTQDSIGKQLTDNVNATISSRAPSVTALSSITWTDEKAGYLDTTISSRASQSSANTIQTDIIYIRTKADSIYTDTQYINGKVDEIVTKWGSYSASDIVTDLDTVKTRIGTSTDIATNETLFGRTKFIQEKWDTQTGQIIYDIASSTLALVGDVQTELGYNGTSTTAYADIQLVKGWTDELEGYMGTPSDDSSAETLFGKIKDVREKLDQLDTLETKLDTIDSIVNTLRASQQLNYTVELSDVDEILQGNIYRTKLSIWDYENNPADASTTPTITIYNTVRTEIASSSMTALSTGVYEYTYSVPSDAISGLWESMVNIDLGGTTALTLNDYWEVQGSPAQVIINSMSDLTVPSISANVTISNEGNSGYEYQYEWCVVDSQDNQCGEGDDIDYASAAKYLNVDEDWTTKLGLTVPSTGDYWFKVVVYYGTEASGASRTFTVIEEEEEEEEEEETQGGGGGNGTMSVNLSKIYSKLLEVQNELGYHDTHKTAYKDLANTKYSLGILPNQISDPLYTILTGVSSNIQTIGGDQGYNLDDLYTVSQTDSGDLKYIVNKTAELKAMIDVNKLLISTVANQPIIKTWWEEGSIILKIMVANPLDAKARTVEVKEYLPKEVRSEHIIKIEQSLQLEYDSGLDSYFVSGEVELDPGERKTLAIRAEDVFKISEDELNSLKEQSDTLMTPLQGTSYFAQAAILKSEIDANINGILRQQTGQPTNIEKRILTFRDNQKDLQKVQKNIESLKQIVSEVSGKGGVFGSLFGVSTTMTWAIIIIVVVGIAVLMILLYTMLSRQRAMEHHISGGKRLKAPPMIDVKKQAKKIKGGLLTYFLPPFGKSVVDLKQLIKMIKILIIIGILVVLVLLGFHFFESKNNSTQNNSDTQEAILNPSHTSKETTSPASELDVDVEMDLSFSKKTEPNQEVATKQNKLKIIKTGIGWLNVRSKPSTTDSKILDTVDVGEEFNYTDQQDNWYKIILDDNDKTEGWVFGEYIEIIFNF